MGPLCRCGMCVDHVTRWLARSSSLYKCVTCMRQHSHYFAIIQCATSVYSNLIVCLACLPARYWCYSRTEKKIKRFVNRHSRWQKFAHFLFSFAASLSIYWNAVKITPMPIKGLLSRLLERKNKNIKAQYWTSMKMHLPSVWPAGGCVWGTQSPPVHKQRDCKNKYEVMQSISILFGFH